MTSIRRLLPKDLNLFTQLINVFEDVFEMQNFVPPPPAYLQKLLEDEQFFVYVALQNDIVLGGLTAYTLNQYYSIRPLVYIFDLAVKREWQRQGMGRKLMDAIKGDCTGAGVEEVFVQADLPDQHAIDFYSSIGGIAERVIHFYYPVNNR